MSIKYFEKNTAGRDFVVGDIHYIDTSAYKGAGRLTIERIQ